MKMSFLNKYFSTQREANNNNREMYANDSSRTDHPKRSHQWLNAAADQAEPSSKKRQAVETAASNCRQIPGSSYPYISRWENVPIILSGPGLFGGHLIRPEPVRICDHCATNISSVGNGEPNTAMTNFQDRMRNEAQVLSFGRPQSHYFPANNITRANKTFTLMGHTIDIREGTSTSMGLTLNYNFGTREENVAVAAPSATSEADVAGNKKGKKRSRKNPNNNFPTNVKSLFSTGIFNGVPVKYSSWARDKNLRGIIKEGGYSCGCNDCKFSKIINSFEFERHAGCKTKHPNNHVYFENGKTVYAVVLELQKTLKEKLFETIQNVTGSPLNQEKFSTWKESLKLTEVNCNQLDGVAFRS